MVVCGTSSAAPPTKPHIVFVLVDDWGFADAGFWNPNVKTPSSDKLAHTGLILNRHQILLSLSGITAYWSMASPCTPVES